MWFFWNNFERTSINKKNYNKKSLKNVKWAILKNIKWFFVFAIVFWIFIFWKNISVVVSNYVKETTWTVVKMISSASSKEAQKDSLWNVNILILWMWWKNHQGWYLTDSMMIASFNPNKNSLTFLSIPRDLYVKYNKYSWGRINYIFAKEFLKTRDYKKSVSKIENKVEEITWLDLNYHVLVDFSWFEKFINQLWWIKLNVKEKIVDHKYPWPNWTYQTFRIDKWLQTLDGETALKYARSRYSSSDFSRSVRQEQIIKAIIDKLVSSWKLLNPRELKSLYIKFEQTVKTDFDFQTLLSFIEYAKDIKIKSYSLHGNCYYKNTNWDNLKSWCLVFPARREDFDGQSVLLPKWSNSLEVDNYDTIKQFAFIVLWYPEIWLENMKIQVLNWIKNEKNRKYYNWNLKPIASNLAYKLKNYWFNVIDVSNSEKKIEKNVWYVYNDKGISKELLESFVWNIHYTTWSIDYEWKWFDTTLILWEDYLYGK